MASNRRSTIISDPTEYRPSCPERNMIVDRTEEKFCANKIRCTALGPLTPANQFCTVLSLAFVSLQSVFTACRDAPISCLSATSIAIAYSCAVKFLGVSFRNFLRASRNIFHLSESILIPSHRRLGRSADASDEVKAMSTNRPAKRTLDKSTQQRAAAYVRMSTEHQQYSTENQLDVITAFALSRNLEITKVYTDAGKSGLRLEGRDQLKSLLTDVESGFAEFGVILVYDVSRWGRFQDPDESASYEIRCKQAGVRVLYCAEQFENDGSAVSSIIKNVKRTMAGEYSRELSVKVHAGQLRLIQLGVRQGGAAGYGLTKPPSSSVL